MDANGTRFHLLLGRDDWARCLTLDGERALDSTGNVRWDAPRSELTLWQEAFRFPATPGNRPVTLDDRRGAAGDRFGNWYWIAPARDAILVYSSGTGNTTTFWPPPAANAVHADDAAFASVEPATQPAHHLQGLAVTDDHYLVVGTLEPAGLLVFDLYSTGAPRQRLWPFEFEPFDIAARGDGGVWILERTARRVWELDRRFDIVARVHLAEPPLPDEAFTSAEPTADDDVVPRVRVHEEHAWQVAADDPIAVAGFDDGVLVLERSDSSGFARVHWLVQGAARGAPASTQRMSHHIELGQDEAPFTLRAHDFALGSRAADDPDEWRGRLYIANGDGNQAFAFGVAVQDDQLALEPLPDYYPIRLFGGRALVDVDGEAWYDCGERWVRLVAQSRPRYADNGEVWTPIFDSGEPGCVWHRLMLDGCIPPTAGVTVYTRASDDWRDLTLHHWLNAVERDMLGAPSVAQEGDPVAEEDLIGWEREPAPYLRGDGAELPYVAQQSGGGRGTFELLLQRARGRYLQVKLVLHGNGRSSPRLRALRVWYPRFSYAERYLPAVYRENAASASFVERFLANMEGIFTTIEDRMAFAQLLFDADTAPAETLDWLGSWFGVALDPAWDEYRRRLFIRHAMDFFALRGTVRGLQLALRLALDEYVDDSLFDATHAQRPASMRIIERFRARRTPRALLGDVTLAVPGPQLFDATAAWRPAAGAADLHHRYRTTQGLAAGTQFPLVPPAEPADWSAFAHGTLGFTPAAGAAERTRWQAYLQSRYESVSALNAAHARAWSSFDNVRLPASQPVAAGELEDWRAFQDSAPQRERRLWQSFLARRYRTTTALNDAWKTNWSAFADVALHDRVPVEAAALADWFTFEGTVLAMHAAAHRFTVMLPIPKQLRADTPSQQRRLKLARAVLELEKPVHTLFDVRYYWAMFRLGEVRLGDDTLIDLGSRSPELMAPMVLGERYLAESYLAAHAGEDAPQRMQTGRDRLGYSARIGGP